jgi:hypothetical protein
VTFWALTTFSHNITDLLDVTRHAQILPKQLPTSVHRIQTSELEILTYVKIYEILTNVKIHEILTYVKIYEILTNVKIYEILTNVKIYEILTCQNIRNFD